jgi:hypothetical protein
MHRPPIPPSNVSISMATRPLMSTTNPIVGTLKTKTLIWFPNLKACVENPTRKKVFEVMV